MGCEELVGEDTPLLVTVCLWTAPLHSYSEQMGRLWPKEEKEKRKTELGRTRKENGKLKRKEQVKETK